MSDFKNEETNDESERFNKILNISLQSGNRKG